MLHEPEELLNIRCYSLLNNVRLYVSLDEQHFFAPLDYLSTRYVYNKLVIEKHIDKKKENLWQIVWNSHIDDKKDRTNHHKCFLEIDELVLVCIEIIFVSIKVFTNDNRLLFGCLFDGFIHFLRHVQFAQTNDTYKTISFSLFVFSRK